MVRHLVLTGCLLSPFLLGCGYTRTVIDKDGKKIEVVESVFSVEITGECDGIRWSSHAFASGYISDYSAIANLDRLKQHIRIPFKTTFRILVRDQVLLAIYSTETNPRVRIEIKRNGQPYYSKNLDFFIAPIYLNLNG